MPDRRVPFASIIVLHWTDMGGFYISEPLGSPLAARPSSHSPRRSDTAMILVGLHGGKKGLHLVHAGSDQGQSVWHESRLACCQCRVGGTGASHARLGLAVEKTQGWNGFRSGLPTEPNIKEKAGFTGDLASAPASDYVGREVVRTSKRIARSHRTPPWH